MPGEFNPLFSLVDELDSFLGLDDVEESESSPSNARLVSLMIKSFDGVLPCDLRPGCARGLENEACEVRIPPAIDNKVGLTAIWVLTP